MPSRSCFEQNNAEEMVSFWRRAVELLRQRIWRLVCVSWCCSCRTSINIEPPVLNFICRHLCVFRRGGSSMCALPGRVTDKEKTRITFHFALIPVQCVYIHNYIHTFFSISHPCPVSLLLLLLLHNSSRPPSSSICS